MRVRTEPRNLTRKGRSWTRADVAEDGPTATDSGVSDIVAKVWHFATIRTRLRKNGHQRLEGKCDSSGSILSGGNRLRVVIFGRDGLRPGRKTDCKARHSCFWTLAGRLRRRRPGWDWEHNSNPQVDRRFPIRSRGYTATLR